MSTHHDMMLTAAESLDRLRNSGVDISVEGDTLLLNGPKEALADDFLDELRKLKPELLKLLSASASDVLTLLTDTGVTLRLVDGDLRLWGPTADMQTGMRAAWAALRPHKPEVLKLLASPEHGPDMPAAKRIEAWLRIVNDPPATACKCWKRLADATEAFATGCWAHDAISAGWNDTALFALHGGIIPEQSHRALCLMIIDESRATLMNGRGQLQSFLRPGIVGRPWWKHPKFASGCQSNAHNQGSQ